MSARCNLHLTKLEQIQKCVQIWGSGACSKNTFQYRSTKHNTVMRSPLWINYPTLNKLPPWIQWGTDCTTQTSITLHTPYMCICSGYHHSIIKTLMPQTIFPTHMNEGHIFHFTLTEWTSGDIWVLLWNPLLATKYMFNAGNRIMYFSNMNVCDPLSYIEMHGCVSVNKSLLMQSDCWGKN